MARMCRGEAKARDVINNPASPLAAVYRARALLHWRQMASASGSLWVLRWWRAGRVVPPRHPVASAIFYRVIYRLLWVAADQALPRRAASREAIILSGELLPVLQADDRPADDPSPPLPVLIARAVLTAAPPARVPGPAGATG